MRTEDLLKTWNNTRCSLDDQPLILMKCYISSRQYTKEQKRFLQYKMNCIIPCSHVTIRSNDVQIILSIYRLSTKNKTCKIYLPYKIQRQTNIIYIYTDIFIITGDTWPSPLKSSFIVNFVDEPCAVNPYSLSTWDSGWEAGNPFRNMISDFHVI